MLRKEYPQFKISKNHALNLIDSKILDFQKILDEATYENRYNEKYDLAYHGTENLLKELFSEEEEVKKFRNNINTPFAFVGEETNYAKELQDYKNHIEKCISQLKVYREKILTFWNDETNRIEIIIDFIKRTSFRISFSWKQLEERGAKYPILLGIVLGLLFIVVAGLYSFQIYPSSTSIISPTSNERAELTINKVYYNVNWIAVMDENNSELLNIDKYQIQVITSVSNKNDSKFDAEITKTEYHFWDLNNNFKNHWISRHETIPIYPGITFPKSDKFEVQLKPGNYTLSTRIEYEDKNGILTPLMFSANIKILYNDSEIVDNQDWR
jgi:hypothetical protein